MNDKDVQVWGIRGGRTGDAVAVPEKELCRHLALA